jgi:23S rRNA-/tRNA-specific pseudouridylate synthase
MLDFPTQASQNLAMSQRIRRLESALRTTYWKWLIEEPLATSNNTITSFLNSKIAPLADLDWAIQFNLGGIYLNGQPVLSDMEINAPAVIEYYQPRYDLGSLSQVFPEFHAGHIVFEDDHLLCAFKPAGLPTMPAREQRLFSLKSSVERYLGGTVHMPSRLDMSVSGLVLMSKSPQCHPLLQQLFERKELYKLYLMATPIAPKWSKNVCAAAIGKDPLHPVLRKTVQDTTGDPSARTARTVFYTEGWKNIEGAAILLARPITGRTHQIRVHASAIGFPIIGDRFYGNHDSPVLCLTSYAVSFCHPITGQNLFLSTPNSLLPLWLGSIAEQIKNRINNLELCSI